MPTRRRWQRNGPDVRAADRVDLLTDRRLIKVAVIVALAGAVPFAAVGWAAAGGRAALGAVLSLLLVGLNGAGSAWISARGGRTESGIKIGWVVAAMPLRLALLVAAIAVLIGPLGLPARPVVLAVCVAEVCVTYAQAWMWMRGPSFVGPIREGRTS